MALVVASLLLILSANFAIESLPIKNGFSIKLKPQYMKNDFAPKTFGSIFTKISQELTPEAIIRKRIFSKTMSQPSPELGLGCSNQVARLVLPQKQDGLEDNETQSTESTKYFNLPIVQQPFKDYKVLVVTAPPDIKMGRGKNSDNVVIYVVFSEDKARDDGKTDGVMVPEVYFVSKSSMNNAIDASKEKPEPIFIVSNNRTVTKLRSNQVEKFLRFRNKLINRYNYDVI